MKRTVIVATLVMMGCVRTQPAESPPPSTPWELVMFDDRDRIRILPSDDVGLLAQVHAEVGYGSDDGTWEVSRPVLDRMWVIEQELREVAAPASDALGLSMGDRILSVHGSWPDRAWLFAGGTGAYTDRGGTGMPGAVFRRDIDTWVRVYESEASWSFVDMTATRGSLLLLEHVWGHGTIESRAWFVDGAPWTEITAEECPVRRLDGALRGDVFTVSVCDAPAADITVRRFAPGEQTGRAITLKLSRRPGRMLSPPEVYASEDGRALVWGEWFPPAKSDHFGDAERYSFLMFFDGRSWQTRLTRLWEPRDVRWAPDGSVWLLTPMGSIHRGDGWTFERVPVASFVASDGDNVTPRYPLQIDDLWVTETHVWVTANQGRLLLRKPL